MFDIDLNQPPQGFCGCLPRRDKVGDNPRFKVYGTVDETPIIPRSEWVECSLRHKAWDVVNQADQNSCCPSATRGAVEILREINGLSRIKLSQGSLYSQISGGRDAGANISDALEAMMDVGMTPISVIDEYDWRGKNYPTNWKTEAKKYRILEAFDCPTFDAVASAVQRSMPVVFGVYWGSGGHAITAIGLKQVNGIWYLKILNSWGSDWEDQGFGDLSESKCSGITSFGAFAIRAVTIPSEEELPPPPF